MLDLGIEEVPLAREEDQTYDKCDACQHRPDRDELKLALLVALRASGTRHVLHATKVPRNRMSEPSAHDPIAAPRPDEALVTRTVLIDQALRGLRCSRG